MINLLPHREERRKRKKIAFYAGLAVAAVAGLAVVGAWYLVVQQLISSQQQRTAFLQTEIKKLDEQIKDIASLKAEIASLKARQKAVEDLQSDRNVPVNVLNELVRKVPEGIYITAVKQDGKSLNIAGIAQTQERVAELLRNTTANPNPPPCAAPDWLVKPELIESKATTIQGANREQKRLFDFSARVTVKRPEPPAPPASGPVPPPPNCGPNAIAAAASAPASSPAPKKT